MGAAANSEYGACYLAVQIRLVGGQPTRVQAVAAAADLKRQQHLAVTVGRAVFYIQDWPALAALRDAVRDAAEVAEQIFGPEPDAFTEAEEHDRMLIARYGKRQNGRRG